MNDKEAAAWSQGARAGRGGYDCINPYNLDSDKGKAWACGYKAGARMRWKPSSAGDPHAQ